MRRILIALKDGGATEQLRQLLDSPEYKIFTSGTFEEAMEVFRAEEPDLVLAELDLPPNGGDLLCKDIKKSLPSNNTFVILACGATAAELRKCGRSGADSYVRTPINPEDITRRINSILQTDVWRAHRVLVKVRVESSFQSEEFFCTSHDLSATGILLETEKSLARGDIIHCSFFLPDMERIRTACRVVRIIKGDNAKQSYGAEFIKLDEHQLSIVNEFISIQRGFGNII